MSKQSELNSYIEQIRQRLRLGAWLRGAAIFAGTALMVTIALVLLLNQFAFPARGIAGARLALLIALALAAAFGIAMPLARMTRTRAVRKAEAANPELEQRLAGQSAGACDEPLPYLRWRHHRSAGGGRDAERGQRHLLPCAQRSAVLADELQLVRRREQHRAAVRE